MKDYHLKNCCIYNFSLDDVTDLPFKDSLQFLLRKFYIPMYNNQDVEEFVYSETEFVDMWIDCLRRALF